MSGIIYYYQMSYSLLQCIGWSEQLTFVLYNPIYLIIIAWHSSYVNRDYHFGMFIDGILQLFVVHLVRIWLGINENQFCSNMAYRTCCGSICI